MEVLTHLDPIERPSAPVVSAYENKVQYTVDFFERDGNYGNRFLYQKNYAAPISFRVAQEPNTTRSVLQEVKTIIRSQTARFRNPHPGHGADLQSSPPTYSAPSDELNRGDIVGQTSLHIHSNLLLNALRSVIQFQSLQPLRQSASMMGFPSEAPNQLTPEPVTDLENGIFLYPFKDLFFHRDDLKRYKASQDISRLRHTNEYNRHCDEHIDILLEYLDTNPNVRVDVAEDMFKRGVTTFKWVWLLLRPGAPVYVREGEGLLVTTDPTVLGFSRRSVEHSEPLEKALNCKVDLWNLDFNGRYLSRTTKTVQIPFFEGEKNISELSVFPTSRSGDANLQASLIERGKKFVDILRRSAVQEYSGPSGRDGVKRYNSSRLIVDYTDRPWEQPGWYKPHHSCKVDYNPGYGTRAYSDYDSIDLKQAGDLTDLQYMLCWSHVYGFSFQDRTYDLFAVHGLREATFNKDMIKDLIVADATKKMVMALCEVYDRNDQENNLFPTDLIRGKGEGRIILLHGAPGTGKTFTAELVAEYTARPLLTIPAADLGDEPGTMERTLQRFFRDAGRWDAILLLDEADVYVAKRTRDNHKTNVIVSVFLRALEYFKGILFLTTNRVGVFDVAFMTRIHVQISYPQLSSEARQQIWSSKILKLRDNHINGGQQFHCGEAVEEFLHYDSTLNELAWNGRQISSVFQTAVSLAVWDAKAGHQRRQIPILKVRHVKQVVKMSREFQDYRKQVMFGETTWAYNTRMRAGGPSPTLRANAIRKGIFHPTGPPGWADDSSETSSEA
ncbi:P-loop containing nucleoside triphosphate hydrolase protein [Macrophomina phaseolina]|uniref:P-loop containing nucleoside triphosphate hydrolase protein n=1 Tax=Macrophomina phaseolina TaxID=35725 RepID=A0ABQ8GE34_9PEZI|nr:P-loop containing nucleoside triphosphate hydrolase protein [Macrophomina phaseolina]